MFVKPPTTRGWLLAHACDRRAARLQYVCQHSTLLPARVIGAQGCLDIHRHTAHDNDFLLPQAGAPTTTEVREEKAGQSESSWRDTYMSSA